MFKKFLLPVLILNVSFYYGFYLLDGKHSYVGTKTCSMCHKKEDTGAQYTIWEKSRHAQAYKTLQTDAANDIAKERGFTTKAAETEACLKCHVSGYSDAVMVSDKFSMADGVQCETCHGAGSGYKTKKIMENRELSVENGLVVFENNAELCTGCHNEESPSFKGFNYEEMWEKIKHPNPKRVESKI